MMSPMEARIALADLIALQIDGHGMDRAEFASRTSFFDKATLSRYLGATISSASNSWQICSKRLSSPKIRSAR